MTTVITAYNYPHCEIKPLYGYVYTWPNISVTYTDYLITRQWFLDADYCIVHAWQLQLLASPKSHVNDVSNLRKPIKFCGHRLHYTRAAVSSQASLTETKDWDHNLIWEPKFSLSVKPEINQFCPMKTDAEIAIPS